jgi:hypothetical protein
MAAGVTKSAIYKAIKSGRLAARKLNGGSYAIYPAKLLRAFPSMRKPQRMRLAKALVLSAFPVGT